MCGLKQLVLARLQGRGQVTISSSYWVRSNQLQGKKRTHIGCIIRFRVVAVFFFIFCISVCRKQITLPTAPFDKSFTNSNKLNLRTNHFLEERKYKKQHAAIIWMHQHPNPKLTSCLTTFLIHFQLLVGHHQFL